MAEVVIMDAGIGGVSLPSESRAELGCEHEVPAVSALRILKVRKGDTDPTNEKFPLKMIGIEKLKT